MTKVNYELVYKARPLQEAIHAKRRAVQAAIAAQEEAEKKFRTRVAEMCGCTEKELRFPNIMCMAEGISCHVYKGKGVEGVGNYKCVFCGCDDLDF